MTRASGRISRSWLWGAGRCPDAAITLVCFPYAGGGPHVFRDWAGRLAPDVEVLAASTPGRPPRLSEEPMTDLGRMASMIAAALWPRLDRPFAFFGHSMGALLAYETARELRRLGAPMPDQLLVSAFRAPHVPPRARPIADADEAVLLAELRRLGGTPPEVLAHPELIGVALPPLRADLAICECYEHVEEAPLAIPLTVFGGRSDPWVERADLEAWQRHSSASFALHLLDGGHFFLDSHRDELIDAIGWDLTAGAQIA